MKIKIKQVVIFMLCMFVSGFVRAAIPSWSVNVSTYDYNMNMTVKLNVSCEALENPANMIGAFVNGVCRGVANTSDINGDDFLAGLTIFSNSVAGESIVFKVYNFDSDSIIDMVTTVNFQDGAVFGYPSVPYVVYSNFAPTNLTLLNNTVDENSSNVFVGTLAALDQNHINVSFSKTVGTGDTDNDLFNLSSDSIFLVNALDYEIKNSYSIRMAVSDNAGCQVEQQLTITVVDVNDVPTDVLLSNVTIEENQSIGTTIGVFTTLDQDAGDTQTLTFKDTPGNNNASFSIVGNELRTQVVLDFETNMSYEVFVESTDGLGASVTKQFSITVTDNNDVPTAIALSDIGFLESAPINTLIGSFISTDQDTNDLFTYTFDNSQSNNNDLFLINGVDLLTNSYFDFETKTSYQIRIKTTDLVGATYTTSLSLQVLDVNDPDSLQKLIITNNTFPENEAGNTFVGKFITNDKLNTNLFTYQFENGIAGFQNNVFEIRGDSLFFTSQADFETTGQYNVLVKSSSIGTIPIIRPFNIVVVDVNDVPTNVTISNNTIIENNVANAFIGTLITTDQDVSDTFIYSFSTQIGTNDNAMFNIVGDQLYLMVSSDYEDKNQLAVHVKTQDQQGLSVHIALTINVIDVNEAPQLMPSTFFVDENLSASASIGTLEVVDQDGGDGVTLSVLGDGKAYFTINSSGALQALVSFDYETQKQFEINVLATDIAGLTDIAQVQVFITDVFEAGISLPTIAVLSPNGDGKNDNFTIDNVALYSNCSLQVFNTAGSVVYSVDSNYDNSWDGTYKGQSLDNGTYYYLLQSNDEAGVYFNGSFTIIK